MKNMYGKWSDEVHDNTALPRAVDYVANIIISMLGMAYFACSQSGKCFELARNTLYGIKEAARRKKNFR